MASVQLNLFLDGPLVVRCRSQQRGRLAEAANANLDAPLQVITPYRVHAAMLYQASSRNAAMHKLLRAEQGRGSDFRHLTPSLPSTPRSAMQSGCWNGTLLTRAAVGTVYPRRDTNRHEVFVLPRLVFCS